MGRVGLSDDQAGEPIDEAFYHAVKANPGCTDRLPLVLQELRKWSAAFGASIEASALHH